MRPLALTAGGIIRTLSSIDAAVRGKAELLRDRLEQRGIEARVEPAGESSYAVIARGEDLFALEFGGVERLAEASIDAAIQKLKFGDAE